MRKLTTKPLPAPELSGEQNMLPPIIEQYAERADDGSYVLLDSIIEMKRLRKERHNTWTEEQLRASISDFFDFCAERELEPSRPLLRIWLGISDSTLTRWQRSSDVGFYNDVINEALDVMEAIYFSKLDEKANAQIFKLKSKFGYKDTADVAFSASVSVTEDNIDELIGKLGLN